MPSVRWIGFDRNGVARVYADNHNNDVAETACKEEAAAYVRCRPDTGPLASWEFAADFDCDMNPA